MTCRRCHTTDCACPDAVFQGAVVIDNISDPGSYARHDRDTACMRSPSPSLTDRTTDGGGGQEIASAAFWALHA